MASARLLATNPVPIIPTLNTTYSPLNKKIPSLDRNNGKENSAERPLANTPKGIETSITYKQINH
jgi:hypothetical protein